MSVTSAGEALRYLRDTVPRAIIHKHFPMNPPPPTSEVNFILHRLENEAHKMASKARGQNPLWNKTEFINISLDVEEGKKFKTWYAAQGEKIADILGQVMVDDYKISCSWDDSNQCFIGTFTGKEDQRFNAYKALSSRSDDWYEALALTVYKHVVMNNSGAWSGQAQRNNWG